MSKAVHEARKAADSLQPRENDRSKISSSRRESINLSFLFLKEDAGARLRLCAVIGAIQPLNLAVATSPVFEACRRHRRRQSLELLQIFEQTPFGLLFPHMYVVMTIGVEA
jgi:hypothetical protein